MIWFAMTHPTNVDLLTFPYLSNDHTSRRLSRTCTRRYDIGLFRIVWRKETGIWVKTVNGRVQSGTVQTSGGLAISVAVSGWLPLLACLAAYAVFSHRAIRTRSVECNQVQSTKKHVPIAVESTYLAVEQ